jgi:hypothetical protein
MATPSMDQRQFEVAEQHALATSIRRLAIDVHRDASARKALDENQQLSERMEQHQFELNGAATPTPIWATASLPFDHVFTTAAARRQSQLLVPQVWFGFELLAAFASDPATAVRTPADPRVMLGGSVIGWDRTGTNITGCTVQLWAMCDPALAVQEFQAVVHATFQGYGVISDPEPDMEG